MLLNRAPIWFRGTPLNLGWVIVFCLFFLSGCASSPEPATIKVTQRQGTQQGAYHKASLRPYTVRGVTYHPEIPDKNDTEVGLASWYGSESGSTTAIGEYFNPNAISAAHKTLPLPCWIEVKNLENGKTLKIRVNDRGPFVSGRILDLSKGAAKALGVTGTTKVRITFLGPARPQDNSAPNNENQGDTGDEFYVQLGSFSQKENAENATSRIDNAKISRNEGRYIVYLGPYNSQNRAQKELQEARDRGFDKPFLRTSKP